jgi:hypothetical protein
MGIREVSWHYHPADELLNSIADRLDGFLERRRVRQWVIEILLFPAGVQAVAIPNDHRVGHSWPTRWQRHANCLLASSEFCPMTGWWEGNVGFYAGLSQTDV